MPKKPKMAYKKTLAPKSFDKYMPPAARKKPKMAYKKTITKKK